VAWARNDLHNCGWVFITILINNVSFSETHWWSTKGVGALAYRNHVKIFSTLSLLGQNGGMTPNLPIHVGKYIHACPPQLEKKYEKEKEKTRTIATGRKK
jgi:hypothetical protein